MNINYQSRKKQSVGGYTLIEILIVLSIFMLVMGMSVPFFIEILRSVYTSDAKLELNQETRAITGEFLQQGRSSQSVVLYSSFSTGALTESLRLGQGEGGNFTVLVKSDNSEAGFVFEELIGYYKNDTMVDGVGVSNINRFELEVPAADGELTLEEILLKHFNTLQASIFLEDVSPVVGSNLFINLADSETVHLSGEVTRGEGRMAETKIIDITITSRG